MLSIWIFHKELWIVNLYVNCNHKLIIVNLFSFDLEDSDLLIKRISKTTENETKEQKGEFISMFLGTSGTALYLEIC